LQSGHTKVGSAAPIDEAFGDVSDVGTGDGAARVDHQHAMPNNPFTTHNDEGAVVVINGTNDNITPNIESVGPGVLGEVLTSNGPGMLPTFLTPAPPVGAPTYTIMTDNFSGSAATGPYNDGTTFENIPDLESDLLLAGTTWEFELVMVGGITTSDGMHFGVNLTGTGTGGSVFGTVSGQAATRGDTVTCRIKEFNLPVIEPENANTSEKWWQEGHGNGINTSEIGRMALAAKGILVVGDEDATFVPRVRKAGGGSTVYHVHRGYLKMTQVV
jgi:hypothetical protein